MTEVSAKLWVWRFVLGVISLLLVWRITTTGLSQHYTDGSKDDPNQLDRALAWNADNPQAQRLAAEKLLEGDAAAAIEAASAALRGNPADAWASVILAKAHLQLGDGEKADRYAQQALRQIPTRASVLLQLADYWDRRGNLVQTLDTLGKALSAKPDLAHRFHPVLLKLAEVPEQRVAFQPFTDAPPVWWNGFFAYLAKRAFDLETMAVFLTMRRESETPLSEEERSAAVARLMADGEWSAAYLLWVNGLPKEHQHYLGGVYNGGFEVPISNEGFDWHSPRASGVVVEVQRSFGIQGQKALHLIFEGREFQFNHLYQPLFLAPGDYEFIARVRPDRLQGRGGLSWVIRCVDDPEAVLGTSGRFLGSAEWKTEKFGFRVPEGACAAQILRLESQGNRLFDHKLQGEIWFDRIGIRTFRPE